MHLFPQAKWVWATKGSKHVTNPLKEDKRQYTRDIAHNANGEIIRVHMVFAGTTSKSLPDYQIRAKYSHFQYGLSPNHWANHPTKVAFVERIYEWVVNEYMRDNPSWTREYAVRNAKCILLLDCWPVNLTQIFRDTIKESCPGMLILYIPAGYTGSVQVRSCALFCCSSSFLRV